MVSTSHTQQGDNLAKTRTMGRWDVEPGTKKGERGGGFGLARPRLARSGMKGNGAAEVARSGGAGTSTLFGGGQGVVGLVWARRRITKEGGDVLP